MTETTKTPRVLFVCSKNGGKSQLAAGLMNQLADGAVTVYSAGTKPGQSLNPQAVESLTELGIDITGEHPKPVTDEVLDAVDVVIVLGTEAKVEPHEGNRLRSLGNGRALRTRHRRHGTHAPGPGRHQGPGPETACGADRELGHARPGMFPRKPSIYGGGNAVRVPPRAQHSPRQRGFLLYALIASPFLPREALLSGPARCSFKNEKRPSAPRTWREKFGAET